MTDDPITGRWWRVETPEREVAGELALDAGDVLHLQLTSPLSERGDRLRGALVLGMTSRAKPITAEIAYEINRRRAYSPAGSFEDQTLLVEQAFVGGHLVEPGSRRFSRAFLSLSDLGHWSGFVGPNDDYSDEVDPGELVIRYREPEPLTAQIGGTQVILHGTWSVTGDGTT